MRFDIRAFRFCAQSDYNEYYQNLNIEIADDLSLKDLMEQIKNNLHNFAYDEQSFGFRINGKAIFSNVKLADLRAEFGEILEIDSLNQKYALKDLLINKDEILKLYAPKLDKFTFLNAESRREFKKYILINLISPLSLEDYVGDGYASYIKWMSLHYADYADILLSSIMQFEDGIINHIPTADLIFPRDCSIDDEIKSLQKELFNSTLPYIAKLKKENAKKYRHTRDF